MFKKLNILKPFFEEPNREFNIREVARILDISPATASKELHTLSNDGILKEKKERTLKLYKANLESGLYKDIKTFYNIRKLKDSGLLASLNKFYLMPAVVLFGSCAYGTDTETSDFDLLVVSEKTEEFPRIKLFERRLNRKIHIFAVKDIRHIKNRHLINNILNGITIQGRIRWI